MKINSTSSDNLIKKEYSANAPGHVQQAKYFYFDPTNADNDTSRVLCGGYEKCAPDFKIERETFPFYALIFTLKGKGSYTVNSKKYSLQYGSLTVISPNIRHILESDPDSPMEQIFVLCLGKQITDMCEESSLFSRPVVNVSRPDVTSAIFNDILEIGFNKPKFAENICECYLKAIILDQAQNRLNEEQHSTSFESLLRCKQYIENNSTTLKSSAEIAEKCCLDIRYIARLFKKHEQIRPYDYLMKLKTDKAVNLLITSNLNINQIASTVGFDDPYHFSRIFKKRFKLSPSRYRTNLNSTSKIQD